MSEPTDLHAQLVAEVQRRLDIARAAASGPWTVQAASTGIRSSTPYAWVLRPDGAAICERHNGGTLADVEYIALHDPADAIRRYEADLRRLDRHQPKPGDWSLVRGHEHERACHACAEVDHGVSQPWPCPEIADLAASLEDEEERG